MFPFLLQVPSSFQTDCMKNRQNEEELHKQLVSYFHGCSVNVQNMTIFVTNNSDVSVSRYQRSISDIMDLFQRGRYSQGKRVTFSVYGVDNSKNGLLEGRFDTLKRISHHSVPYLLLLVLQLWSSLQPSTSQPGFGARHLEKNLLILLISRS